jgi:hypothetical protein
MSKWRDIQKGLIEKSIHNEKLDIIEEDISIGRIQGTIYYKKNTTPTKGILLVHGVSRNRYSMGILAERLAEYGFFCLSIDLPSHYLNLNTFTLGELSETVTEGVLLLKTRYGMNRVAVIGHSIGAIGCLFSNAGYNIEIEQNIFSLWKKLSELIDKEEKLLLADENSSYLISINEEIKVVYSELKNLILISLKKGIQEHANVSCYVFLAPPDNCKTALPAVSLLKRLNHKWIKKIIETLFHNPQVKRIYRDGNPVGFVPENKDEYTYWQFFKTTNDAEFVKYLADMKEPADFLTLVEGLSRFQHKDDSVKFFEYYKNKYLLAKPKLFIYGMRDLFLRPFMPFAARRLEKFYESCGNAEIHRESFSHVMMNNPKQQFSTLAIDNDKVTELIIKFLDKNF